MGANFVRRIARLLTGGKSPEGDDATFGGDITVHVPSEEIDRYDSIMGVKVEPGAAGEIDSTVATILSIIEDSEEDPEEQERRERIIAICKEVLAEEDQGEKKRKISELLSVSSGVTAVALFTIRLKEMTGL